MDATSTTTYPQKWQERFAFFEQHGAPNSPGFKEALKGLPSGQRRKITFNWLAWLFGPFYFLAVGIVVSLLPDSVGNILSRGVGFGLAFLFGLTANYSYFLKERRGDNGWNLFEGMRW